MPTPPAMTKAQTHTDFPALAGKALGVALILMQPVVLGGMLAALYFAADVKFSAILQGAGLLLFGLAVVATGILLIRPRQVLPLVSIVDLLLIADGLWIARSLQEARMMFPRELDSPFPLIVAVGVAAAVFQGSALIFHLKKRHQSPGS